MCGFACILRTDGQPVDAVALRRMSQSITHRGPDDGGEFLGDAVGFGFRRLSILDLSQEGHQPMVSAEGRHVMVFNGEIFNYVELREELRQLGHSFRSTGDSEVLLRAYLQWGADCLPRLNGMWAFLIYDRESRVLFGARDRFGIKPLYVHRAPNAILWASEIKAIHESGMYRGAVNWKTASRYLVEGSLDLTDETFFEGIDRVPAGSAFSVSADGRERSWAYWSLPDSAARAAEDPPRAFADLLENAVELRMRSDVPVGVCLSGGLDSTSIVCAMARLRDRVPGGGSGTLNAFCYHDPNFDERPFVADTVAQSGAIAHDLATTPRRIWDDLPKVLRFHDEPMYSLTAVVGYQLFGLAASEGVKVILNGQAADEVIGGYPPQFRDLWYTLLVRGRLLAAWRNIKGYSEVHGGSAAGRFLATARHTLQGMLSAFGAYRRMAAKHGESQIAKDPWFRPDLISSRRPETRPRLDLTLNAALQRCIERGPLPNILRVEDRNSMAHSIEVRVPFMDYRLVSLVFGLAEEWKVRGPWNKYVLREAMRSRIPESVRARPQKMGFPTGMKTWLAGELHESALEVLENPASRQSGRYDMPMIRKDLERYRRGEIEIGDKLFRLLQTEIWLEGVRRNHPGVRDGAGSGGSA